MTPMIPTNSKKNYCDARIGADGFCKNLAGKCHEHEMKKKKTMKHKILYQNIKLEGGRQAVIANATDLFSYIDSDFKKLGTDNIYPETSEDIEVAVCEFEKNSTFKDIFLKPDEMCLSQGQIIEFIKIHKDKLRTDGYATFFLFKANEEIFVANVSFDDVGQLGVYVRRLSFDYVWNAEYRHRIVVPQLALKHFGISPSDALTLEKRVENIEEWIRNVKDQLL
jgi:hypothetical protein